MYHHRSSLGPVEVAFTDRHDGAGGVLDLALAAHPAPLQRVLADLAPGHRLAELTQVHGRAVVDADADGSRPGARPEADALVSTEPGTVLLVRAADCVPVLLADPGAGVVGAAHAGRQGLAAGVVPATVAVMRERGARRLVAWVGPHVCGRCYEVPAALQAEVGDVVPAAVATTSWGTPALDLGAGVRAQLAADAVEVVDPTETSACTLESAHLFSHRRDGAAAGRHAGLVRLGRAGGAA